MNDAREAKPERLAASYVLGALFVGLIVVAWLRGAGRFLLPLLLLGGVGLVIARIVRKIREPLP